MKQEHDIKKVINRLINHLILSFIKLFCSTSIKYLSSKSILPSLQEYPNLTPLSPSPPTDPAAPQALQAASTQKMTTVHGPDRSSSRQEEGAGGAAEDLPHRGDGGGGGDLDQLHRAVLHNNVVICFVQLYSQLHLILHQVVCHFLLIHIHSHWLCHLLILSAGLQ